MYDEFLRLFVVANTPSAATAISYAKKLCEELLDNQWHLEIIDVVEQPEQADQNMISAVPALLCPKNCRRVVGDLSNFDAVITALGLQETP